MTSLLQPLASSEASERIKEPPLVSPGAEAPIAAGEGGEGLVQVHCLEIGPEFVHEHQLGVGGLPEKEVGDYTAFGINFMFSLLFIALLMRRESMYIAISKWLGTFFAYIATALTATTSLAHPWPASPTSFVVDTVRHATYPLTPLINVLYGVTFFVDILYIVLLRSRLKECGISPWRRV